MTRTIFRAALAAAALSLAACGRGDAANDAGDTLTVEQAGGSAKDASQPAALTPADYADPPVVGRDTQHHIAPGQTYASCMAQARGKGADERGVIEIGCRNLPDAPKK
jgi:hypothetical protein